ncbi:hypothetical protein KP509_13G038100 [Ceratopteris richardii]|uniref:Uncharacterized protein n=1 Tax=Ceratopteris richardii TaxID=49495 RepID=A0A8T2TET6_CERRI|nr:hypothetical protein KP509_13G038100 [Ceratopteris richardii]
MGKGLYLGVHLSLATLDLFLCGRHSRLLGLPRCRFLQSASLPIPCTGLRSFANIKAAPTEASGFQPLLLGFTLLHTCFNI